MKNKPRRKTYLIRLDENTIQVYVEGIMVTISYDQVRQLEALCKRLPMMTYRNMFKEVGVNTKHIKNPASVMFKLCDVSHDITERYYLNSNSYIVKKLTELVNSGKTWEEIETLLPKGTSETHSRIYTLLFDKEYSTKPKETVVEAKPIQESKEVVSKYTKQVNYVPHDTVDKEKYELLPIDDAAQRLDLVRRTINDKLQKGKLLFTLVGSRRLVLVDRGIITPTEVLSPVEQPPIVPVVEEITNERTSTVNVSKIASNIKDIMGAGFSLSEAALIAKELQKGGS